MFKKILIIGAHFDDSDLAAGGSAAKWISEGKTVYKMTLTDNKTNFTQRNVVVDFNDSLVQSRKAADALGIQQIEFDYQPCNGLVYSTEVMQKIEKILYDYDIDTVLIHSPNDANQDHVAAFTLCSTAARHCQNIILFNINGYVTCNGFAPNYFVDISSTISVKEAALKCYGSEHDRFNRLFSTCLERNKVWGYSILSDYAEAFEIMKLQD
jgi:LmbE family N-acetylglucosaminyl deacetylase